MKTNYLKTAAKSIDKHIEKLTNRRDELRQKIKNMEDEIFTINGLMVSLEENKKQLLGGEPQLDLENAFTEI